MRTSDAGAVREAASLRWWEFGGIGWPRSREDVRFSQVAAVLLVGLTVWGYTDIRKRGIVSGQHPELHRTDVTVFTEAGAAFFDGRNPYAVENPRGWNYLYPPLFGLMVAPLSVLDPVSQNVVFYAISVVLAFATYHEAYRLCSWLSGRELAARSGIWIAACGAMAMLLPTLECFQRGQVGVALTYSLLLGLRLAVEAQRPTSLLLAGLVLAWPVAVKLIPALPVAYLVWLRCVAAFRGGHRDEYTRGALGLGLGVAAGLFLFLLLIPAGLLGWSRNLGHLRTWSVKVVHSDDAGQTARFHIDSTTNQSLPNAAYRLATTVRPLPLDEKSSNEIRFARTAVERRWAEDRAESYRRRIDTTAKRWIEVTQGLVVLVLLALGLCIPRGDATGEAAAFGLACVAMLLLSPVAWTHYYMMVLPAVLFVPLWLLQHGGTRLALPLAAMPAVLVWAHFVFKPWAGPVGLLGLGTAAWFFASAGVIAVSSLGHPGLQRADPRSVASTNFRIGFSSILTKNGTTPEAWTDSASTRSRTSNPGPVSRASVESSDHSTPRI